MAIVNFYDDVFCDVCETKEVKSQQLKEVIDSYLRDKDDYETVEVYNCETDTTEYRVILNDSYKVLIFVNGNESNIEYEIKENDVISVIFIPLGSEGARRGWMIAGGVILLLGAAALGITAIGIATGAIAGSNAGLWATAALGVAYLGVDHIKKATQQERGESGSEESKKLPTINGAENESIIGKRYPFVMGKHLLYPYIVGNPYHETHVSDLKNAKEGEKGQQFHVMYVAGYGPLRLTNLKLDNTMLAYNESSDYGDRQTVLHGQLSGCDDADTGTVGDITKAWAKNDVKVEILQAGSKITDFDLSPEQKYGTIYTQSVSEKEVNANILYVYDKMLEDVAQEYRIYKGAEIPIGYRTNSVRFSSGCPQKLQVEIDLNNGYFKTRTEGNDAYYYKVPLVLAVQWRLARPNEDSSDAESPVGWNSFDYLVFDEGNVEPIIYNSILRKEELEQNKGISPDTPDTNNKKWLGAKVFNLCESDAQWKDCDQDQITAAISEGIITATEQYKETREEVSISYYPYTETVTKKKMVYNYSYDASKDPAGNYRLNDTCTKVQIRYNSALNHKEKSSSYNIGERRYVFEANIDEESCRKMINFETGEYYLDNIEVRVVRLTPCYLDEQSSSDDEKSAFSYQDLVNWTYLRTYKFDKKQYLEALNSEYPYVYKNGDKYYAEPEFTNEVTIPDEYKDKLEVVSGNKYSYIWAKNFPERFATENDLDKFCFIGLQLRQDINNTVGSSAKKFSVIAESFNPKYSEADDCWYPNIINEVYAYYHKYENEAGKTIIDNITIEEYEEHIGEAGYYKQRKGNDFVKQIRDDIFIRDNIENGQLVEVYSQDGENFFVNYDYTVPADIPEGKTPIRQGDTNLYLYTDITIEPMLKYTLPESVARKYNSSNTSSIGMLALMGNHLGSEAKTYDCTEVGMFEDFFNFCNDITDGTEEKYLGIPINYITTLNLTASSRKKTKTEIEASGWELEEGYSFDSVLPNIYSNDDVDIGTADFNPSKAYVLSPILDNGNILSQEQLSVCAQKLLNDEIPDYDTVLAYFTGSNCYESAKRYAFILRAIQQVHYTDSESNLKELIKKISGTPINAIRSGIKQDIIFRILEDLGKPHLYSTYLYSVLEQMNITSESDNLQHVKFECNGVITENIKLETLLPKIFVTGRAYVKRSDDNKYEPLIGRPNPYPVTVLNQRNCLSKSNTKTFAELPCGFQVSMVDAEDNYTTNDFYVMNKGEDYTDPTKKIEQFSIDYVTNRNQMASLAMFNLATRLYQIESYARTVGMIGYSLSLGDTVLLQDDTLLVGTDNGGRIQHVIEDEYYIYGFITDEPFEYTGEIKDGLSVQGCTIVQPSKYEQSRCVTVRLATPDQHIIVNGKEYSMKIGLTNIVILHNPIIKNYETPFEEVVEGEFSLIHPEKDNLVAFGNVGEITIKAVITNIVPKDKGKFDLTLAPYNEDLYKAGLEIPVFKSHMTEPQLQDSYEFQEYITTSQLENKTASVMAEITTGNGKEPLPALSIDAVAKKDFIELNVSVVPGNLDDSVTNYHYQISREEIVHYFYTENIETGPYYSDPEMTVEIDIPIGIYYETGEVENQYYYTTRNFVDIEPTDNKYFFNRDVDGYPEKGSDFDSLNNWQIRVKTINVYGNESYEWVTTNVDTSSYGTWIIPPLLEDNVSTDVMDRTVTLNAIISSISNELYGDVRFKIYVKRVGYSKARSEDEDYDVDDIVDQIYYQPNLNGDFLTNEDSYKIVDGSYEICNGTFIQTMPLVGQNKVHSDYIVNTVYKFKIVPFSEAYNNDDNFVEKQVTALCTNIRDIVMAKMDYQDLYVKKLSAICANIGLISQGGMGDFSNQSNYWALSNLLAQDTGLSQDVYKGAFRVGGENEYIKVDPVIDDGVIKSYTVEIRAGNILLKSSGTDFTSGTYIYDENDPEKRMYLSSSGFIIQRKINNQWENVGNFSIDKNQNLIISNADDDDLPNLGFIINGDVYHFDNNYTDEAGNNPALLSFSEDKALINSPDDVLTSGKHIEGDVFKTLNIGKQLVFLNKMSHIKIENKYMKINGTIEADYNVFIGDDWGFETKPTDLFKPKEQ